MLAACIVRSCLWRLPAVLTRTHAVPSVLSFPSLFSFTPLPSPRLQLRSMTGPAYRMR
jgi:hypothetical protein